MSCWSHTPSRHRQVIGSLQYESLYALCPHRSLSDSGAPTPEQKLVDETAKQLDPHCARAALLVYVGWKQKATYFCPFQIAIDRSD